MNEWRDELLRPYVGEVERQCYFAILAADRYNESIGQETAEASVVRQQLEAYAAAQGILTAGASISKLMWVAIPREVPPEAKISQEEHTRKRMFSIARADALRKTLQVSGDSILQSRQVRNAVEHFDDRLDAFHLSGQGILIDANIVPIRQMGNIPQENMLRHIDPETSQISVLDKAIRLQDLLGAIDEIGAKAKAYSSRYGLGPGVA